MAPYAEPRRFHFGQRQGRDLVFFARNATRTDNPSCPIYKETTTTAAGRGQHIFAYWRKMAVERVVRLLANRSQQIDIISRAIDPVWGSIAW
ncbi:Hypothetical protein SMAX5B_015046 [Scophthalmus maximus]|uniref:Uncharacterized protein n=1 Tax=Scophthalmus maximus TaxID=52904 RepID=A0A2U9BHU9_SCOMX|nr:Hypothetical protein SMAX5B_015046 [Scophthalmus maximus]